MKRRKRRNGPPATTVRSSTAIDGQRSNTQPTTAQAMRQRRGDWTDELVRELTSGPSHNVTVRVCEDGGVLYESGRVMSTAEFKRLLLNVDRLVEGGSQ
jgi:hypothetical protein